MMPATPLSLDRIQETFELLTEWDDRYQFIIELGEQLPPLDARWRTDAYKVKECMSNAWITAECQPDAAATPVMQLYGDSDNNIIKGIVAILIAIYSGKTPQQALAIDTDQIFAEWRLYDHLSPNRHVGVYAMVQRIQRLAQAFAAPAQQV